jgi:hypothetical protein
MKAALYKAPQVAGMLPSDGSVLSVWCHVLQVGIEECLHIEFEYDKARYHLKVRQWQRQFHLPFLPFFILVQALGTSREKGC